MRYDVLFGRMLGVGTAAMGLCCWPSWCFSVKHAVFASWFCLGTEEISLSPVQNVQIHANDRGRCVTHCWLGKTKAKCVYFILSIDFVDFLLHIYHFIHCHYCVNCCEDLLKECNGFGFTVKVNKFRWQFRIGPLHFQNDNNFKKKSLIHR